MTVEVTTWQSATLRTNDGVPIAARVFAPEGTSRATVLIHGATATPQSYYRRFAEHLASQGATVISYDYRGVGASRPMSLVGFSARISDWAERDARAAIEFSRSLGSPGPFLSIGHSFGAQLVGLIDEAREVDGALMVGAQLGYYGHWPLAERARLFAIWTLMVPTVNAVYGYVPGRFGLSQDLPEGVAEEWARWCRSENYLLDYVEGARGRFERFDKPTQFYSFTDDEFAPRGAVEAFLKVLPRARIAHRRFAPVELGTKRVGHFGFFRPGLEHTLWQETREWLDAHARGSGPVTRSRKAFSLQLEPSEILRDLDYGRA